MACDTEIDSLINNKIINFSTLKEKVSKYTRIVQSHGVFDLLHIGHIKHFEAAKKYGDVLVVTVTPDRFVNKGPNRPRFNECLRAEAIAALACVDFVIINQWPTATEAIRCIQPIIYAKGDEYQNNENDITGKITEEADAVKSIGGKIIFTSEITFSSSQLLNTFFSPFSQTVQSFLDDFKKRYDFKFISKFLEKTKTLKILLVGEAIIDDYRFTEVIGKSGKEPTLVAKYKYHEIYAGGILAVANHLADFCAEVTCLTYLGEKKEYENIINNSVASNVRIVPIYKKDSPTIVKRRYLDEYLRQKLFEEYEINDDYLEDSQRNVLMEHLSSLLKKNDLVIVADYGHGLLDEKTISHLIQNKKFLAVNTQSNAGNNGFHFISKYTAADYVSLASRELQLNYRQKHLSTSEQLTRLLAEHDYDIAMITSGRSGAHICKKREAMVEIPTLGETVIDRVGAGDAVLALSSLFAYQNAPADLIGFIGNVAGAEAINIMGNKTAIHKTSFMKHIMHLLK